VKASWEQWDQWPHLKLVPAGIPLLGAALGQTLLNNSHPEPLLLQSESHKHAQGATTHDDVKVVLLLLLLLLQLLLLQLLLGGWCGGSAKAGAVRVISVVAVAVTGMSSLRATTAGTA
jgi:hypothetical protein